MQKEDNIYNFTKAEFAALFAQFAGDEGSARQRASVLFRSLYKEKKTPTLHKSVLRFLEERFSQAEPARIFEAALSTHDGSVKFALELSDGQKVESVLIPERGRLTLCLSTQVGCAQGCRFCQTGRMGLLRSLSTAEIVGQYLAVEQWRQAHPECESTKNYAKITNIVYMGMGEPLDNVENVIESIQIFCDNEGLNLSPNKITVSSVGLLPQLDKLLLETKVSLALSLHSPFDEQRTKVMPVNLRFPLAQVLARLQEHAQNKVRSSFMIQYTLLRGINDSLEHAQELGRILKDIPAKINLIPLNEHEGTAYRRPDLTRVFTFQQTLKEMGFVTTIRLSKGRDIQAACGQLIKKIS